MGCCSSKKIVDPGPCICNTLIYKDQECPACMTCYKCGTKESSKLKKIRGHRCCISCTYKEACKISICINFKQPGYSYCSEHLCKACGYGITTSIGYAIRHNHLKCKCNLKHCRETILKGTKFCDLHQDPATHIKI